MTATLEKEKLTKKSYTVGLDIIRIIAMFLVIMVHSTSFYGFLAEEINSFTAVIVGAGRYLSMACVPLFILLTGYLNLNKKPEFSYYIKFLKILIEFFLSAAAVALFYSLYLEGGEPFWSMMKRATSFYFPQYSWYIRMYVGLFLLAPFFNYIIAAITGKQAILLTVILILVFSNPFISDYWQTAYPIMYYFIGAIIRKTQFKVNRIFSAITVTLFCFLQVWLLRHPIISTFSVENHNNLACVIVSVFLFLLLCDVRCVPSNKLKRTLTKTARVIANASMPTFLISVIFETLTEVFFGKLALTTYSQKLPYLLYLTPLKFVLSVIAGIIVNIIATLIFRLIMKAVNALESIIKRKIAQSSKEQ